MKFFVATHKYEEFHSTLKNKTLKTLRKENYEKNKLFIIAE